MRPLIEILEDERAMMQRLESIYRYMLRDDDPEVFDILHAKKVKLERDLDVVRAELKDYMESLFRNS
jgi:hypothetical protein